MPPFSTEQEPEALKRLIASTQGLLQHSQSSLGLPVIEDVPVLTDVVEHPAPPEDAPPPAPELESLGEELASAIQKRLRAEVPSLVEAVLHAALADISGNIRQGMEDIAQDAIQDFIKTITKPAP
jgi:hypothetical protein